MSGKVHLNPGSIQMEKLSFLSIFCVCAVIVVSVYAYDESRQVVPSATGDNVYCEEVYVWSGLDWFLNGKSFFKYDQFGNAIVKKRNSYYDGSETNLDSVVWIYNEQNQLTKYTYYDWDDEKWYEKKRENYSYDNRGNLIIKDEWRFLQENWILEYQTIYIFDDLNNQIEMLEKRQSNLELQNYRRYTYLYNEENQLIRRQRESWHEESWESVNYYDYIYNESGQLIEQPEFLYLNDGTFMRRFNTVFDYNEWGNLIERRNQTYHTDGYDDDQRYLYEYDDNQWLIKERQQLFKDEWENKKQVYYENNQEGNLVEKVEWSWLSDKWSPNNKIIFFYNSLTGIQEHQPETFIPVTVQTYPNPFNAGTKIAFRLVEPGPVSIEIYNINGKKVKTLISNQMMNNGDHEQLWDGTNDNGMPVATGIYVVQTRVNNASVMKRITLLK